MTAAVLPAGVLLVGVGLAAGLATLAGGYLALRLRGSIDLLLGFSSGAVIGVALLDLLPEAQRLASTAHAPLAPTTAVALGLALYLLLDRVLAGPGLSRNARAHLGPASLVAHSLMDGLGVGLAFHVSSTAGLLVALAVLAHDLMDGVNTVALGLAGTGRPRTARMWLWADAAAPLVGIGLASLLRIEQGLLASLMGLFAGFFLYIGASELLPRARQAQPTLSSAASTLCGLSLIYLVVRLAGG
jgi:zinc transporter ZupT